MIANRGCEKEIFRGRSRTLFFQLFFGFSRFLVDLLLLNLFGNFERENLIGMSLDTILKIAERFSRSHLESVEGSLFIVELSANVLKIFFGAVRREHGDSVRSGNQHYGRKRNVMQEKKRPFSENAPIAICIVFIPLFRGTGSKFKKQISCPIIFE